MLTTTDITDIVSLCTRTLNNSLTVSINTVHNTIIKSYGKTTVFTSIWNTKIEMQLYLCKVINSQKSRHDDLF